MVVNNLDGIQTQDCYEIDYLQKARMGRTGTDREATCDGGLGGVGKGASNVCCFVQSDSAGVVSGDLADETHSGGVCWVSIRCVKIVFLQNRDGMEHSLCFEEMGHRFEAGQHNQQLKKQQRKELGNLF